MSSPHRRTRRTPLVLTFVATGALAFLATACNGDPDPDLTVTTVLDGRDADPGDGTCEMTTGEGDCSLRAAIDEANADTSGDMLTISLPPGTYVLGGTADEDANVGGDLDVTGSVKVLASGPGAIVDGNGGDRLFDTSGELDLEGVTLRDGDTVVGGAVRARTGSTVRIVGSTLTANTAEVGGALAVETGGSARLTLSTFSGNVATVGAGGIANAGTTTARNVTITDNALGGLSNTGSFTLDTTIVADQRSGADCVFTSIVSAGSNLDSDGSCLATPAAGDQPGASAALSTLAVRGGYTPTHVPRPSSDALDAAAPSDVSTDQRAVARPQGAGPDIGAGETTAAELAGPTATDDDGSAFTTDEETPFTTGDVTGNDTDPLLDPLTVTSVDTTGMVGTLVDNGDGTFDYDPAGQFDALSPGEVAYDSFTYTVTDGDGQTDTARVTITVDGRNTAPTAGNDSPGATAGNTLAYLGTTVSGPAARLYGNLLLANDVDPDDDVLVASLDAASPGAAVTVNPDGSFTYRPPVGVANTTDSFTYAVEDSGGLRDVGTVTITITGDRVWYVDNRAAGPGTGTSTDPFSAISSVSRTGDPDAANDVIYVHHGDGTSAGLDTGITLETGQRLVGEGASLFLGGFVGEVAPAGDRPILSNTAGTVITLASNTTVSGLDVNATSGAGSGISCSHVFNTDLYGVGVFQNGGAAAVDLNSCGSTNEMSDVSITSIGAPALKANISGTVRFGFGVSVAATGGRALDISDTRLEGFVDSMSAQATPTGGISLLRVSGDLTSRSTDIRATGGSAIYMASSRDFALDLGPTTVANTGGAGIDLISNPGATTTVALADTTVSGGPAVKALNAGTLTITGAPDLTSTGGAALDVEGTTLGTLTLGQLTSTNSTTDGARLVGVTGALTLPLVTATDPADQGIEVRNQTSGSVTITRVDVTSPVNDGVLLAGNTVAVAINGGVIDSPGATDTGADGVDIDNNPGAVTLRGGGSADRLDISGFADLRDTATGHHGIRHAGSGNLTVQWVRIHDIGEPAAGEPTADHGIAVSQPRANATVAVADTIIEGLTDGDGDGIWITSDATVASPPVAPIGRVTVDIRTTTVDGNGTTFAEAQSGVHVDLRGGAPVDVTVASSTFTDLYLPVLARVDGDLGNAASPATVTVRDSTLENFASDGIAIESGEATSTGDTYLDVLLAVNTIDGDHPTNGSAAASQAISVRNNATQGAPANANGSGRLRVRVEDNTITDVTDQAVLLLTPTGSTGATELQALRNTYPARAVDLGILVRDRGTGPMTATIKHNRGGAVWVRDEVDPSTMCVDIAGNGSNTIRLTRLLNSTFSVVRLAAAGNGVATAAQLTADNPGPTATLAEDGGGQFTPGGASCPSL